jgi:hypothetical protein
MRQVLLTSKNTEIWDKFVAKCFQNMQKTPKSTHPILPRPPGPGPGPGGPPFPPRPIPGMEPENFVKPIGSQLEAKVEAKPGRRSFADGRASFHAHPQTEKQKAREKRKI